MYFFPLHTSSSLLSFFSLLLIYWLSIALISYLWTRNSIAWPLLTHRNIRLIQSLVTGHKPTSFCLCYYFLTYIKRSPFVRQRSIECPLSPVVTDFSTSVKSPFCGINNWRVLSFDRLRLISPIFLEFRYDRLYLWEQLSNWPDRIYILYFFANSTLIRREGLEILKWRMLPKKFIFGSTLSDLTALFFWNGECLHYFGTENATMILMDFFTVWFSLRAEFQRQLWSQGVQPSLWNYEFFTPRCHCRVCVKILVLLLLLDQPQFKGYQLRGLSGQIMIL